MQDARALPSKVFRPPFGLGRVTFERPLSLANNTKSLLPGKPPASRVPSSRPTGRTERRRRHFGLRHPWLRPKPASNILVLAPNRGRAVLALIRFSPYAGCGCAIIPDGAPDLAPSPRWIGGGIKTSPAFGPLAWASCNVRSCHTSQYQRGNSPNYLIYGVVSEITDSG